MKDRCAYTAQGAYACPGEGPSPGKAPPAEEDFRNRYAADGAITYIPCTSTQFCRERVSKGHICVGGFSDSRNAYASNLNYCVVSNFLLPEGSAPGMSEVGPMPTAKETRDRIAANRKAAQRRK